MKFVNRATLKEPTQTDVQLVRLSMLSALPVITIRIVCHAKWDTFYRTIRLAQNALQIVYHVRVPTDV